MSSGLVFTNLCAHSVHLGDGTAAHISGRAVVATAGGVRCDRHMVWVERSAPSSETCCVIPDGATFGVIHAKGRSQLCMRPDAAMDKTACIIATDTSEVVASGQTFFSLHLAASGMARVTGTLQTQEGSVSATGTAQIEDVLVVAGAVRCDPAASVAVRTPSPQEIQISGPVKIEVART